MGSTKTSVYAAIAGNLGIAATKLTAAAFSGSSSMLTEGIHSLVDTGNNVLMLVGMHASRKPPDERHPFGYGQALYFYALMVAVLLFGIGGGLSIYEGIRHVMHPAPVEDVRISYIVLAIAAGFEGTSWYFGLKAFLEEKQSASVWGAVRQTKDPATFAVLLEDSAALVGIAAAAAGIFLASALGDPRYDGAGSIVIGLLLCAAGAIMLRESKGLLLGEAARSATVENIRRIISGDPAVRSVARLLTLQLGPDAIMLAVDLRFAPHLGFRRGGRLGGSHRDASRRGAPGHPPHLHRSRGVERAMTNLPDAGDGPRAPNPCPGGWLATMP